VVDLKNQTDAIVHETDKQLEEHKDKLSEEDVAAINSAKEALQKAAEGDDKAVIEAALADFQSKAQKLGEAIYAEQQAQAETPPEAAPAESGDEGPVDADFEVKA
jgi:molecular chaperone DnaK